METRAAIQSLMNRTNAMPTAGQDEPLPAIRIAALSESHGLARVSKKLR